MTFTRVAALADLCSGEMKGFLVQGTRVLLVRKGEAIYAYEDRCAHQRIPLSIGFFDGETVISCRAHGWEYHACTGQGINPKSTQLRPFPVQVQNGEVFVDVPTVSPP